MTVFGVVSRIAVTMLRPGLGNVAALPGLLQTVQRVELWGVVLATLITPGCG